MMPGEARVLKANRSQLSWDLVDLEALLAMDHRARLVWRFVETLELGPFYEAHPNARCLTKAMPRGPMSRAWPGTRPGR